MIDINLLTVNLKVREFQERAKGDSVTLYDSYFHIVIYTHLHTLWTQCQKDSIEITYWDSFIFLGDRVQGGWTLNGEVGEQGQMVKYSRGRCNDVTSHSSEDTAAWEGMRTRCFSGNWK